jgi:hypothetical protein
LAATGGRSQAGVNRQAQGELPTRVLNVKQLDRRSDSGDRSEEAAVQVVFPDQPYLVRVLAQSVLAALRALQEDLAADRGKLPETPFG